MFDWLGDIFSGIGNLLGDALASLGESISNSIFDAILRWWYEMIYNAVADFFSQMSGMGGRDLRTGVGSGNPSAIHAVWLVALCCRTGRCCVRPGD